MRRGYLTEQHLRNVARVYIEAHAVGAFPTRAVAEHFGIPPTTAHKRVHKARLAGYLPATTPGKAASK